MPMADFGTKVNFGGNSQFVKLKSKGDKIRLRLLGAPFIEGKHFFETEDGWDVLPCPKVNEGGKCEHCDQYWRIVGPALKTKDKTLIEQAKKEARKYQNRVIVHYPIIDRDSHEFKIFQTGLGVRNKIEAEFEAGVKVLNVDFVVLRTEQPGPGYYALSRVDSADTPALTPEEQQIVEDYKTMDLTELVNGAQDRDSGVAFEANSEVREDDVEGM